MSLDISTTALQNADLRIPHEYYSRVRQITMTRNSGKNRDHIPFERYLDVWWLALCIGIQEGKRTRPDKWHTFVRAGEIMASGPWRILQLQLLAIGETGGTDILSRPVDIIEMANEYAATGLPIVINEVLGSSIPIWNLTEFVEKRLDVEG